jgi:hypothetical protein
MSSDIQKKVDKKPCLCGFDAQAGDITGKSGRKYFPKTSRNTPWSV